MRDECIVVSFFLLFLLTSAWCSHLFPLLASHFFSIVTLARVMLLIFFSTISFPKCVYQVHGITTAASLWLSAAVGVGAGGALYAVTTYSVSLRLN